MLLSSCVPPVVVVVIHPRPPFRLVLFVDAPTSVSLPAVTLLSTLVLQLVGIWI